MERSSRGSAGLAIVVTTMARPPRRAEVICMVELGRKRQKSGFVVGSSRCGMSWMSRRLGLRADDAGIIYLPCLALPKLLNPGQGKVGLSWALRPHRQPPSQPQAECVKTCTGLIALEAYACEASPAVCACPPTRLGPMARGQE